MKYEAPYRDVMAVTPSGLVVLDCGHVRDGSKVLSDARSGGPLGCAACRADLRQTLKELHIESGTGLDEEQIEAMDLAERRSIGGARCGSTAAHDNSPAALLRCRRPHGHEGAHDFPGGGS